jgi:hypothetical protein
MALKVSIKTLTLGVILLAAIAVFFMILASSKEGYNDWEAHEAQQHPPVVAHPTGPIRVRSTTTTTTTQDIAQVQT